MKQIILTVLFDYDRTKRLSSNGTSPISIQAYQDGRYVRFPTGVRIKPAQWHKKSKTIIKHRAATNLQKLIDSKLNEYRSIIERVETDGNRCTLAMLTSKNDSRASMKFTDFIQREIDKKNWTCGTLESYRQTLIWIDRFRPGVTLKEMNKVQTLQYFLESLKSSTLSHNSQQKHYKNVRKFLRLGMIRGLINSENDPTKIIKMSPKKTIRPFLLPGELKAFEDLVLPKENEALQPALDTFLFSCYTGLRFSDLARLTSENIRQGIGGTWLSFSSKKTGKYYNQNLRKLFAIKGQEQSKPEQIALKRLKDIGAGERLFIKITGQAYNRQLKNIAGSLLLRPWIKQRISSHVGRHTAGTTLIRLGVPVTAVQKLLQHSNIKETMIYVHLTGKDVDDALDQVEW